MVVSYIPRIEILICDCFLTISKQVNFYIRGPHGAGKVFTEMFKDKTDNKWKYTYLIVQINSPSRAELMLESYLPAAELRPSAAN